ncbi:MAG: hypothetical protein OEU50_19815, partial [Gammaproteobacteria bacterium]|nr:hypothetical protein [Gammaproteobacteria bacterium]
MKTQSAGKQGAVQIEAGQEKTALPSFGKPNQNSEQMLGRFSDVAMLAADWFWEMDAELRFTYQSSRFEEITGLVGKT